jgi:iron complex transport system substrate-binding protein
MPHLGFFCLVIFILFAVMAAPVWAGGRQEKAKEPAGAQETPSSESGAKVLESGYDNPMIAEETEDKIVAYDYDGNKVTLSKRPERVIVNYTSLVGLWYMAGGEAVGRPDARSTRGIPEEAIDIETTGHVASPNVEKIVALQPDLVILSGGMDNHRNVKEILDQNGTENILLKYENYHDFVYTLDLFARIVGNQEIIQEKVPGIQREVQKVIERYEDEPPFTFLSLFAFTRSVSAELNRANTAHMAMMLGGENIAEKGAPERGQKRITLSMEHIVQRDPDVILVTVMGDLKDVKDKMKEDLTSNQAWDGIEAVKNDRVHYLPAEYFLYKANERYPEAFEYLAERIYQQ